MTLTFDLTFALPVWYIDRIYVPSCQWKIHSSVFRDSPGAEYEIELLWGVRNTPTVERRELIFHEEHLFRNANQVDVVKNIYGIKLMVTWSMP